MGFEAADAATQALGSDPAAEAIAWRVLGSIQAREGRSEADATLERMWALAQALGEIQHTDPAAAALAEHIWLTADDDPDRLARVQEVYDRSVRRGFPWPSGALAFWMSKLGALEAIPERLSPFYRLIMEGHSRAAGEFWEERGVPYEHGLALIHGEETEQIRALRIFEDLGANRTAHRARRALRHSGVRIPRGRSRSTRRHAAGLTARQAEVLELLAEGLSNPEIADRLFVSHRTVENHVAAILMKLDTPSRDAAVAAARSQGILATP